MPIQQGDLVAIIPERVWDQWRTKSLGAGRVDGIPCHDSSPVEYSTTQRDDGKNFDSFFPCFFAQQLIVQLFLLCANIMYR
mmetsp:Transcript_15773/g.32691  ORF Transcript_15773/g.32691 Transcript_15773/m.32691 type:complete len:81 (+) Transcript_15773:2504-2746(+)